MDTLACVSFVLRFWSTFFFFLLFSVVFFGLRFFYFSGLRPQTGNPLIMSDKNLLDKDRRTQADIWRENSPVPGLHPRRFRLIVVDFFLQLRSA